MTISEGKPEQLVRPGNGILADIWDALWKEDAIRSLDMASLSVEVKGGEVYLDGHLARENNLLLIESIAQSVAGVVAVHNRLVTDRDLIIQVAQALARDKVTRHFLLPVNVIHGWIHLGGIVPTREIQFVTEMGTFMRAADCILGKAGGLTVSEGLACGLPLILVDVIPGQETGNANHVVSGNAGVLARDPIEVLETMCHWLEKDWRLYRQQAQNARRLGHPRAAHDVADLAWAAASS